MFRNIQTSLLVAVIAATGLSLIVLVISLVTDTWYFERYHATTLQVIGSYYTAGILIAIPVGSLLSFARRVVVAAILGAFGGIIMYALVGYSMDGTIKWLIAVPLGTIVGVPVALLARSGILADLRKTSVKAQEASSPEGFALALTVTIDQDHTVDREMRIVNEYLINWLRSRGSACQDLFLGFEADPAQHEEIIENCRRLLGQDLHMDDVLSKLQTTVGLIDQQTGETRELEMRWGLPQPQPKIPPPLPGDDSRYMPQA